MATIGINGGQMADSMVLTKTVTFSPTLVKAAYTTPLVLLANADDSKTLIYLGGVLCTYGGDTTYATSHNIIVKYQTAGGGASASGTVADFLVGCTSGSLKTIKALYTDITPEAGKDLVLTFSANPTLGNHILGVQFQYSVLSRSDIIGY